MDMIDYMIRFGCAPIQYDLDRVNCEKLGPGHRQCGVCHDHNKPRFMCGCFNK